MFIDNDCWLKVLHLNMNIACCSMQSIIFRGIFHIDVSFSIILQETEILQWYFSLLFKLSKNYTSVSLVAVVKNSLANTGDVGSIPGWGRSLGRGNGTPLQYSCLGNPMDRGAWRATVYGVTKSQTQLSVWACMSHIFLPPSMNHKSSKVTK